MRRLAMAVWEFFVGDDPLLAAGVVAGLALTAVASGAGLSAWWILPAVVAALLALSLWRAARSGG